MDMVALFLLTLSPFNFHNKKGGAPFFKPFLLLIFYLFIIANGDANGKAEETVIGFFLVADSELISNEVSTLFKEFLSLFTTATGTACEGFAIQFADPDDTSRFRAFSFFESYNETFHVEELLVFLEMNGTIVGVQSVLVAEHDAFIAICHILCVHFFHFLFGFAMFRLHKDKVFELVTAEEELKIGVALDVGHFVDEVIDVELNLLLHFFVACLECFTLDQSNDFLKGERIRVEFAVQNHGGRETIQFRNDVSHVGIRFAIAAEQTFLRDAHATSAIELFLDKAWKLDALAALVVVVREHGKGNRVIDAFATTYLFLVIQFLINGCVAAFALLGPSRACLGDGLVKGCCFILFSDVLSFGDDFFAHLHFSIFVAVSGHDDAVSVLVADFNAPEFGLASKGVALESGESESGFGGHEFNLYAISIADFWFNF